MGDGEGERESIAEAMGIEAKERDEMIKGGRSLVVREGLRVTHLTVMESCLLWEIQLWAKRVEGYTISLSRTLLLTT
ncbi:MAG: hypothetical protein QXT73_07430 [Candidatus Methanomethylicaceae archaeon]